MTQAIDLTPAVVNVTMTAGDDLDLALTARWPDGSPVDCSGELLAQLRTDVAGGVAATFDTTGTADGSATLHLDDTVTAGLVDVLPRNGTSRAGRARFTGVWDLQVTAAGRTRTIAGGTLTVELDVSRTEVAP